MTRGPLPLPLRDGLGISEHQLRRIELTVSCRDADAIPKVRDAGEVRSEDGVRVQMMHDGSRILADCYYGEWMTEIIRRLRGHHEPQEELVVHRILERLREDSTPGPKIVVELGSFWAYYSIWALGSLDARAVLVEPDPANLEVGRTNLELNGLAGRFLEAAVGGPHGTRQRIACESDGVERDVRIVTVPGLLHDCELDRIDLLLVDVQGAELDVLTRATGALREGRVRFLVVSTHHHSISGDPTTHQRCLRQLTDLGAHVIAEHTVGESFSGDGLIAASMSALDRDLVVSVTRARYRDSLFGELEPELADAHRALATHSSLRERARQLFGRASAPGRD